jgi:hypothetical protein
MARVARGMAKASRVAGDEEGDGEGGAALTLQEV